MISTFRSHASTVSKGRQTTKANSASNPRLLVPSRTSDPLPSATLSAKNKSAAAEQILNAGRDVIYKAPSHAGMLFAAWAVFGSGTLCCLYFTNNGFHDAENMKKLGQPIWVSWTYKAVILFMGLCSGAFLAQSFAFVSAIKIVKDAGVTKLLITQRPWFPLWRHHRFLIEPAQLQIDRRVAFLAQNPQAAKTQVGQQASVAREVGGIFQQMLLSPFLIMRKLFFHEGVLKMAIISAKDKDKETWVRLDLDGTATNNGKDLLDVATIRT